MPKGAKKNLTEVLTKHEENTIEEFCNGDDKNETVARKLLVKKYKSKPLTPSERYIIEKKDVSTSQFCLPYKKTDTVAMCEGFKKKICVIDFLDGTRPPLVLSNKFCKRNLIIKYKIIYIAIGYGTLPDIQMIDAAQDICDDMIIYAPGLSDYISKKVKFLLEYKSWFKNTILINDIWVDRDNPDRGNPINMAISNTKGISGIKIVNVIDRLDIFTEYGINESHYKTRKLNGILFLPIDKTDHEEDMTLECSWWFSYYLEKAFGCGKGRLTQYAGTCYLNASINSMLLSENMSNIVVWAMKNYIIENPNSLVEIQKDMLSLACKNPYSKPKIEFLYRIVYNILCTGKTLSKTEYNRDIIIQASKGYFSANRDLQSPKYGYGGYPLNVIFSFLYDMKINFCVRINDIVYAPPAPGLPFDFYENHRKDVHGERLTESDIKNCDLILDIPDELKSDRILETILVDGTSFDLECSQIRIVGVEKDLITKVEKRTAHSIAGYICDSIYKIYDSGANRIMTYNWTDIKNPEILATLSKYWAPFLCLWDTIYIDTSIYINRSKKPYYKMHGVCTN